MSRARPWARACLVPVCAVVLGAGLVTGCGSRTPARSRTAVGQAAQPVVTTVAAQTVTRQLPGYGKPVVHLGNTTAAPEEFIIGELYRLALQQQGYGVALTPNVGAVGLAALEQGSLDLFPEYLNAWDSSVAGLSERFRSEAAAYRAGSEYAHSQGLVLLRATPFSDTWGLAVTAQYAQMNHLRTIADLARGPIVSMGVPLTFDTNRIAGLPAIERVYHVHPFVRGMDAGAQYTRLDAGNLQVAWATTTDPELLGTRYRLLADPKHVFGFGNIVPVTTPQVLQAEGRDFARTINRVDALLTLQAIRGLNAEYVLGGHSAETVAEQFLEGNGILPPSQYAPLQTSTTGSAPS